MRKAKKAIAAHLAINQCRAARAMVGWTMKELAERSGVSAYTLSNFELGKNVMLQANRRAVEAAFREAGVQLLWDPVHRLVGVIGKAVVHRREYQPEIAPAPAPEIETIQS